MAKISGTAVTLTPLIPDSIDYTDPTDSLYYGMPILNVDKAKNVVMIKCSLSPGFAGLPNPLFAMDHTLMVYGDGKKAVVEMTTALNQT